MYELILARQAIELNWIRNQLLKKGKTISLPLYYGKDSMESSIEYQLQRSGETGLLVYHTRHVVSEKSGYRFMTKLYGTPAKNENKRPMQLVTTSWNALYQIIDLGIFCN